MEKAVLLLLLLLLLLLVVVGHGHGFLILILKQIIVFHPFHVALRWVREPPSSLNGGRPIVHIHIILPEVLLQIRYLNVFLLFLCRYPQIFLFSNLILLLSEVVSQLPRDQPLLLTNQLLITLLLLLIRQV
jgi:hypothetical protein